MRTMNSVSGSLVVSVLFVAFAGFSQARAADAEATLKQYVGDLQRGPDDYGLREKIVKLAREMNPPPAVPEEARRHAVMADTLVKEAKKPEEFRDGAGEFKSALLIAPWCLDLYPSYAVALKSAGEYDEAIRALKFYVAMNPGGSKARDAQDEIYILEAKQKKAQREKVAETAKLVAATESSEGRKGKVAPSTTDLANGSADADISGTWAETTGNGVWEIRKDMRHRGGIEVRRVRPFTWSWNYYARAVGANTFVRVDGSDKVEFTVVSDKNLEMKNTFLPGHMIPELVGEVNRYPLKRTQ